MRGKKSSLLALSTVPLLIIISTVISFTTIETYKKYITTDSELFATKARFNISTGIVFGGGVREDAPLPLVQDRLDAAYKLYDKKVVSKLLVSGDNRSLDYNEPTVMKNYLVETYGVDPNDIQEDFAGRSTYETCERANKVFGLSAAFLFSENVHLPRALYLCRHFGINAFGYTSNATAASGLQIGQRWREIWARDKAVFNVNIIGEQTILGDPIDL